MIFAVRHGETDWNAEGRLQGQTDIPLNDRGREQAREVAELLASCGARWVLTSDLSRAAETGARIRARLGLSEGPADRDAGLREQRFGGYEGLTGPECERRFGESWRWWKLGRKVTPPGGETWEELVARTHAAFLRAFDRVEAEGPGIVVSHGGVLRALHFALTGELLHVIGNCEVRRLERSQGRIRPLP